MDACSVTPHHPPLDPGEGTVESTIGSYGGACCGGIIVCGTAHAPMPYGLVDCAGDSCWGSVSPASCIKSVFVFSVVVVISSARRSSKRCLSNHDRDGMPPCFLWILLSLEPVWNQLRYQSGYHPVEKGGRGFFRTQGAWFRSRSQLQLPRGPKRKS